MSTAAATTTSPAATTTSPATVSVGGSIGVPAIRTLDWKEIPFDNGNISMTCQFNKTLSLCIVYINFKTTEDSLLYVLLQCYIHEKVLFNGCNLSNEIYYAYATTRGIVFACSEKKVKNNIVNIFGFLARKTLKVTEQKQTTVSCLRYNKLRKDIRKMNVYVIGKCIHWMRAIGSGSNETKVAALVAAMNRVVTKVTDDVEVKEHGSFPFVEYNVDARRKLDLTLALENVDFVFNGRGIQFLEPHEVLGNKLMFSYPAAKIHSFFVSCGTIPKFPAANDVGGKKHAAKKKYVIECLNSLLFIVTDVRGFSFEIKNEKDIEMRLEPESNKRIKELRKSILKSIDQNRKADVEKASKSTK